MSAQLIGSAQNRVDGRLKVTGGARYAGDWRPDNLAFGYLITSRKSKGKIQKVDTAGAEKAPGVLAVFTPFRSFKLYNGLERGEGAITGENTPPLQDENVRYYGQIVGLVVAESFEQARDAAMQVKIDYVPEGAPITTWEKGVGGAVVPEQIDREKATTAVLGDGVSSIDDALKQSELAVEESYEEPIHHHNPMEPHATTAVWEGDRLTLYDATQGVIGQQKNLAAMLGVDESKVRVVCPFVGGGFGCKGATWMHSPVTAAAARALGRPIKTILSREQMFTLVGHRPSLVQKISLGASKDGTLNAVKHEVQSTSSFSGTFIEAAAHRTSRFLYKSPNILVSHKLVPFDISPPTFMRAPGEAPGMFALECAMDELAVKLGMDPIELRLKNDATVYPGRNVPWSEKSLADCYRIGAGKFDWSKRSANPGSVRDGDWLVGMGMATALYPAHRSKASAKIRLQADGTALVSSATQDLGTGTWTVLAIVAADALGLPLDRVHSDLGDSVLPPAPVSGGSQSVASVTPAIQKAAEAAKKKLIQLATRQKKSSFGGKKPEEISYENGELVSGSDRQGFGAFLTSIGRGAIDATDSAEPGEEEGKYAFHSFGAQFCEVGVNRWTSEIRVRRITTVMDIGKVVNAKTARSQIIGGVVFGIGMALLEGTKLEEKTGRFANANFADYLVATNADVPIIDVHFLDKPDTIFNPIGARGIGEIGITGTPAAIANATFNATGKRIRNFPITADKLIQYDLERAEPLQS
jgi:xanthine dehydrogenase YagR molybdenum-binding subunit